jgi:nucleotide-binding universal stress UspA family protein
MTTILVGVDDSERSLDAIAFALQIASAGGASVLVANTFPYEDRRGGMAGLGYRKVLEADAERLVARLRAGFDDLGEGRVRTAVVARSSAAHGLHDLAADQQADLMIVGSSHVGTAGRVFPGSTGERLLHGAACPVVIVPKGYRADAPHELDTIGVAYDGSLESEIAVSAGAEVARVTSAELRVIRVMDAMPLATPAMAAGADYSRLGEDIEQDLRQNLYDVVAGLSGEVRAAAVFLTGDPAEELAAQTGTLDLLITGSRGYGPLRAVMTGGVTGRVLRDAACPVVVLPRGVETPLGEFFAQAETPA